MRIAFFSFRGEIGTQVLDYLLNHTRNDIVALITRPGPSSEPLKEMAYKHYLPLYQPTVNTNDPKFLAVLKKLEPDLFVSMYYGRLFSPAALAVPKLGCLNMHPSLLPKGRGQGPSTWPIINGDTETGQTIHWLDDGIDTGDVIAQKIVPIEREDTPSVLGGKLLKAGVELFIETWPLIEQGKSPRIKQDDSQATYHVAPRSEHARINWKQAAVQIRNLVRAFGKPDRGAWGKIAGKRFQVWKAKVVLHPAASQARPGTVLVVTDGGLVVQTGEGQILLTETQVEEGVDLVSYLGRIVGEIKVRLG
jgi:methionyl-tRNA formyltransferase